MKCALALSTYYKVGLYIQVLNVKSEILTESLKYLSIKFLKSFELSFEINTNYFYVVGLYFPRLFNNSISSVWQRNLAAVKLSQLSDCFNLAGKT